MYLILIVCLFSPFQPGGHGFVLLSILRLSVEYSPAWIIFSFWSAMHGQSDNHAYRIVFKVINNNNNKISNIIFEHFIYNRQCSKSLAYMISFNPVYNLMMRDKKITVSILQIRTPSLRRVTQLLVFWVVSVSTQ